MTTESDKRKIVEFILGTGWQPVDWSDPIAVDMVLDILSHFDNDPQLAILYWKAAKQKADQAVTNHYISTVRRMGLPTDQKISKQTVLDHFKGDQNAVTDFFMQMQKEGKTIHSQILQDHFLEIDTSLLTQQTTLQ